MHLSLIGMSGSGKSSWALKLASSGFKCFCCDDLITKKLGNDLTGPDGNFLTLGEWMGFPYYTHYKERESVYLAKEIEVLTEIVVSLEKAERSTEQNIVIDTTGSAIYVEKPLLERLRGCTTVVHLSTPPEIRELMLKAYVTNKRPVLWMDSFKKCSGETDEDALVRCFGGLLESRQRLYEQLADVTIDYDSLKSDAFGVENFLEKIKAD